MKKILWLVLLGAVLFVSGNHLYSLFDNSETNYGCVAREIVTTGDALTMHYNGQDWYVHPPLFFWLSSSLCKIIGWNEFALRFWEALFGILGLIVTYMIGKIFLRERVAMAGAMILGSSLYMIVLSRLAVFDTLLNTFMLLQVFFFFKAYFEPQKKGRFFLGYALATTLAVLTKGPIGLVQTGLVIVPFLAIKKDLRFLFDKKVIGNFLLFLGLTSPWYIHQLILHGKAFFDFALRDYTWYRFFGVVESQSGPVWYYLPVLLLFVPWIVYLPSTLQFTRRLYQSRMGRKKKDLILFSWLFIAISFVFFSVAGTKLPNYIMTIFPFMSILIAWSLLENRKQGIRVETLILTIFFAVLFFASGLLKLPAPYTADQNLLIAFTGIPLIISVWMSIFALLNQRSRLIVCGIGGMVIWVIFLSHCFFPGIEKYKESRDFVAIMTTETKPYSIVMYKNYSPYINFYLNHKVIYVNEPKELKEKLTELKGVRYLAGSITDVKELRLPESNRLKTTFSKVLYKL